MNFIIGQRWASLTEPTLGLGVITAIQDRQVQIRFPATGEDRVYRSDNAPLSRIHYAPGDTITDMDEQNYEIVSIEESQGLLNYQVIDADGNKQTLDELDISCFIQMTSPVQRLFSGMLDPSKHFELRAKTLRLIHQQQQSSTRGLLGSRTDLLPHQIYIAHEVASRYAPRVLLADEVGLGKTIEAGMILHNQLLSGQANRVLVLVPDSLVHQWLVEMLRRFNLHFAVFDQERLDAFAEDSVTNPFESEQLVLCPLSLLTNSSDAHEQALACDWDLVIVDEAHHLEWSESEVSQEYRCVESLADKSEGLLLLSATPEQVGLEGHFARLRLLDPARFYQLETFKEEQNHYQALNQVVTELQTQGMTEKVTAALGNYLSEGDIQDKSPEDIIDALLDRHGTGRVLFRNTRHAIQGFPQRCPQSYPLHEYLLSDTQNLEKRLYPEQSLDEENWLQEDPRVPWLVETLKSLKPQQVLVICHHNNTAIALEQYLNQKMGIRSACFHEGLSLIERDRAAAYFAEGSYEDGAGAGAQTLICSEIGSEGRNFQFAHHLVLFDLPLNPDLLEQRIGRLDRIGQKQDIQIHIPYLKNTAQDILYQWYAQGLNLFEHNCSAAYSIYEQYQGRLHDLLEQKAPDQTELEQLITEARKTTEETLANLQEGRDKLIELNSCRPEAARELIENIQANEKVEELQSYMEWVFEHHHVECEHHSEGALIIQASDRTQGHFPFLRDEGNTITFLREKAISREDMDFLSWEHPMVLESMDSIYQSELGSTALATISIRGLPEGTLLVETLFTINAVAPAYLQLDRYLPLSPCRFVVDANGKAYQNALPQDKLSQICKGVKSALATKLVNQAKPAIQTAIEFGEKLAEQQTTVIRQEAMAAMEKSLSTELQRLQALQAVNPSIRDSELQFIEKKIASCKAHIEKADLQLNAVRIMINHRGK